MDYKTMMGYGKKPKKSKTKTKKSPTIVNEIKNEFKEYPIEKILKETKLVKEGPAYEFGKENANIERAKILLDKAMDKMAKTLAKKGHKDKAKYLIQKWNKYDEMIDDCLDDTLSDLL